MSDVVVTGGAGFLGSNLTRRLIEEGATVTVVDDLSTGRLQNLYGADPSGCKLRVVTGDIVTMATLPEARLVFHLASPASPPAYQRMALHTLRTGSAGTDRVLREARGARVVIASTSEVYGDPEVHPQHEGYRGNVSCDGPRSMYDEAKRFSEAIASAHRADGVNVGVVRIFNTYGPRMSPVDGRAVPTFIRQALAGEPLTVHGDGRQTRSLCYVDDLVEALILMGERDVSGPVNLGNPDEKSVRSIAEKIVEITGSASPIVHVDGAEDDPRVRCPDITRARELLSWVPSVDLDEGLALTIDAARREELDNDRARV